MKSLVYAWKCINILVRGFLKLFTKMNWKLSLKNAGFSYNREKEYTVNYKGIVLPHKFVPDFVVEDIIVLEIKGIKTLRDEYFT